MKISLSWLGEYLTFTESDPQQIAEAITAHTAEIDAVEVQGQYLDHCCVGKVLTLEKHPNADKLSLCNVQTDAGTKRVVCGGTNLREGMRVAFAHVGATVKWHGGEVMTLEPVKIRGEQSEGMICAAEELGLEDLFPDASGKSIVDLGDGDDDIGTPLKAFFGLDDVLLHVDNHAITHRADLFSHRGFARECVAMGIATWKKEPTVKVPDFPDDALPFQFHVEAPHVIPRYCSCLIHIDDIGETPEWMRMRLASVGIRSINLPVDITNYVMMDLGVPMHSFDLDDITGDIHARLSAKGETLQTLDEKEWELPEGALIFSDDEGNFDLVGIMGGLRSSTKESTRTIYLHALSLDPVCIRNTVLATGHRTDAATIYEKKVPHVSTEEGFYSAVQLFLDLAPGAKILSSMESFGDNGTAEPIDVSLSYLQSMLGVTLSENEVQSILSNIGCSVQYNNGVFSVTPPLHRLGDIAERHDLLEEVGRIYGYNRIDPVIPVASIAPPQRDQRMHSLRDALQEERYLELLPLNLLGEDLVERCGFDASQCAKIQNPLGHETRLMTPSTLPALLRHAEGNLSHVPESLQTFHISTVFAEHADSHTELGMLFTAKEHADVLHDPFLCIKDHAQAALHSVGYTMDITLCENPPSYAHAGRVATISVHGENVGLVFEVHPLVRKQFDLPARASALLLNLTTLFSLPLEEIIADPVPAFPAISYDATLSFPQKQSLGQICSAIQESSDLLERVSVIDIYGATASQYSVTIRCTYRAADRTLTEKEAKSEFAKVEQLF